jgi:hypothetical protein
MKHDDIKQRMLEVVSKLHGIIEKSGSAIITTCRESDGQESGLPYAYSAGRSKFGHSDILCTAHLPFPVEDLVRAVVASHPAHIAEPTLIPFKDAGLGGDYHALLLPLNTEDDAVMQIAAMSCNIADLYDVPWRMAQLILPDSGGNFPHEPGYAKGFIQPVFADANTLMPPSKTHLN